MNRCSTIWNVVCCQVGYPFRPERLGKYKNESRVMRQPFSDYYDGPAAAAVEAGFGWELDYFGYHRLSGQSAPPERVG